MDTVIADFSPASVKRAADIIRQGGLVAFPTETVYGLGADALNESAVGSIFQAKGRPSDNPLIVHIHSHAQMDEIAYPDGRAETVSKAFMPGSLTIVMRKRECIPDCVTAGLPTVAVRMPLSLEAREFLRACDRPVAAPSANTSTRPSPTTAEAVFEDMNGRIPMILKGARCEVGIESTVLDLSGERAIILRTGAVTATDIFEATGIEVGYLSSVADVSKVNSPGLRYKHYAPSCPVYLNTDGDGEKLNAFREDCARKGLRVKFAVQGKCLPQDECLGNTPEEVGENLFDCLRRNEKDHDVIVIVITDKSERAQGVLNRATRAAADRIL